MTKAPNLIVALPLYKQVPASFFTHWLTMDKTPVKANITVEGVYLPHAMHKLVSMAMDHADEAWDRLVILEHDVIPPRDAFVRMASYGPDKHIVGPVCFQHIPPYTAMIFGPDNSPGGTVKPFGPDIVAQIVDYPALYECSSVAMGCTAIHRDVLENWDKDVEMFKQDNITSHDVHFCLAAKEQGFGVFVDSHLTCDHLSEMPINFLHNQAFEAQRAENETEDQ